MKKYRIEENTAYGSREVFFEEKPAAGVIAALKALKMRWNNKKMCWYGYATADEIAAAIENPEADGPKQAAGPADDQNRLKALYLEEMAAYWSSSKMLEYCKKKAAYFVELTGGEYIALDKPTIETRFCFGHGLNGISTQDDEENAQNMAHYASTNKNYFIDENLRGINEEIKALKEADKVYIFLNYTKENPADKLRTYRPTGLFYGPEYRPAFWNNLEKLQEIGAEDRGRIIAGLEIVKAQFIKRLNTYLKKYGLSKVNTWTYLRD